MSRADEAIFGGWGGGGKGFGTPVEGMGRIAEDGSHARGKTEGEVGNGVSWDGYRMCDSGESELEWIY
jgi:hypothetical protein